MINYSIIIPHRNIPDLLQRCLDSIPQRNDIQIIITDDKSDSEKVNFEQFPGLKYKNTEIIFSSECKGGGFARNKGLEKAKGKWILFADADDYFIPGFLKHLDPYLNSDFDLIYFGIDDIEKKYDTLMRDALNNKNYDKYKYSAVVPFGKMIKHSLIIENNISFDETRVANDRMFSIRTAYFAKNIHFDQLKIYAYDIRPGSLISVFTAEAALDRLSVYLRQNTFLEEIDKKEYKAQIIPTVLRGFFCFNSAISRQINKILKENNVNLFKELLGYIFFKLFEII